ncbi:hypothetical protein JYU12_01600 [bacterium AH-315-K03]|nr:hypothetical protein [bacterium AH-315-K03]
MVHTVAGRKLVSLSGCCGTRFAQTVLAENAGKTDKLKRALIGHSMNHPYDPIFVPYKNQNELREFRYIATVLYREAMIHL